MSHFKLVSTTKASDVVPVNKYVSEKTGITIIIANVEGPLVNGFFCLATEAHDDDGLPHTLEHLIFLGSARYPYKGILDLLANRCMAHGTNAWTDVDHTCYTIYTAGDEGMLTLLPIYLDHILHPTLTDEGYLTEVHHIDGEGNDAGVVYCEMQGRENSADSRCDLKQQRVMYPGSGYASETGGIMENLRTSTNNTKVRNYHKKFYRAENLTIILTGQIEAADVFSALVTVEDDIIAKKQKEGELETWKKPWQELPPPPQYGDYNVQWPADTEDCGQILFAWRGPALTESGALKELTGCAVLLRYLCDTAAAPLQRCLVEIEDALAGDVSYNLTENIASLISIQLDNVPMDKLEAARQQAKRCLGVVRSGEEPLDMERMQRLLKKQLRESLACLESDPHHAVAFRCIGDALYSQSEADFISRMNPQQHLRELLDESAEYFLNLLQRYFTVDLASVLGQPSIALQTKMAKEERDRLEKQRNNLGESGLLRMGNELNSAMEFNERPPPPGTLAAVPVPSCARLRRHSAAVWAPGGEPCPHLDLTALPLYTRAHSLNTNFVYISLILDTRHMSPAERQWLPLHINGLAECAVRRDGQLIPHEEVISDTERLTVMFNANLGLGSSGNFSVGQFGHLVHIETRCEPCDYEAVVSHLAAVLLHAELTKERLLVFAQRLINDVANVRRKGEKMVYATLQDSLFRKDSNVHSTSVLRQHRFLKDLVERLNAGGDSAEAALREARASFAALSRRPWLHLAADLPRHRLSVEPWKQFHRDDVPVESPALHWDWEQMGSLGGGFVVGVGGVESSFLAQLGPGPKGYTLEDQAPLLVAVNYFTQLEGPMWRLIRGSGLSYGYGVRSAPAQGALVFSLYKATNAVAAYSKAKSILDDYFAEGSFDEDLFASARSTALFEVVEDEKCPADVVNASLLNYLRQVDDDYNRQLVCAIEAVSPSSAHAAAARWLPALFDPSRSSQAVVCHPSKVDEMQAAFQKIDVKLNAYASMETSHFNK